MSRFFPRLLAVMLALLLCGSALAEETLSGSGSISVFVHTPEGETVQDAQVQLYRVGDPVIRHNSLAFDLSAAFAGSGVSLSDLSDTGIAPALQDYAVAQNITPYAEQATDAQGKARFDDVPAGLYLVRQDGFSGEGDGVFTQFACFIVSMPMMNEEGTGWIYDIVARPKSHPLPEPSPSVGPVGPPPGGEGETPPPSATTPPEDPPSLPQTGMLRWPVPVLGIGGLIVFATGWALAFGRKKNRNA